MAPSTKVTKVTKPGGKDIRMFFSSGTTATSSQSQTESQKQDAIVIDDEYAAPNIVHEVKRKRPAIIDSDNDSEPVKPRRPPAVSASAGTKRKKSTTLVSSDSEDAVDDRAPLKRRLSSSPSKKKSAVATKARGEKPAAKVTPVPSSAKSRSKAESKPQRSRLKKKGSDDEDYDMEASEDDLSSDFVAEDDEEESRPRKKKSKQTPRRTTKTADAKSTRKTPEPKSRGKVKAKEEEKEEAPEHPKKFNWAAAKAAKLAAPVAHGTKAVPDGAPDALAGLAFVFTGELSSFSRDEAIDLAKRFGGRVTGQPSSKTSYVVLGDNAGPGKLAAIKKHGLKTLNEDEFLHLIATRKGLGVLDEKTKKKMQKEQEAIRLAAREMEKREKTEDTSDLSSQLWTTRYAPQSLKEVCGNKSQVEKLQQWLHDWPTSLKSGFKKPGKNGMNVYRAVLITGSPGIGKTTSAHLCAKLEGFTPIELNASDARSKKLVESGMNINNKSLDAYVSGAHSTNPLGVTITDRTCLIMDEVDGMSAGDRGGVGALNALIKKTKVPVICIANDRQAQKLKPLMSTTFSLPFQKPQANQIRSRLLSIAFKEKMKIPAPVIDQLITGAQSDIRQVLNMLSTWRLSSDTMSFDEGKNLTKMHEKYSLMSPFEITSKMLGPYLFSPTARETLGDKMELYFHDHAFVPLFIQENYLKTQPARIRDLDGPEKIMKHLQLMDKAASSISDADLVDGLIHGPEQHWSLMPLHAVCSTVRPASFLFGGGAHYGGPNSMSFPQWLGQNSKRNKLIRQLGDVQVRMRLKVSGDKNEIRQSYIPALFSYIVLPLTKSGSDAVDDVIEHMDEYFLSKDDWDTIVELGVGDHRDDVVLKGIPAATKTAFTRKYNAGEHPIPFHKALDLGKMPKKLAAGPAPDIEEAFELDEIPEEASDEEKKPVDPDDIAGDKLIHQSKKRKTGGAGKAKGSKKSS